jgi:hypothetical protein
MKSREELYRKVDELLALQTAYLRWSFETMGFSQQQIEDEINFFMLRKAHYLKCADETFEKQFVSP